MILINIALAVVFSFFISFLMIKLSYFLNILDFPDTNLKKHKKPVPYLGGAAVYMSILISVFILKNRFNTPFLGRPLVYIFGISTIIFIFGLIDDLKDLKPRFKIMIHILCAALTYFAGIRTEIEKFPDALNFIITVLWIITVINAFNLLDIMDGLAAGVGIILSVSFYFIAFFTLYYDKTDVRLYSLSLACSLAGFLIWNFCPAKIYLGDSGSNLIGYLLGVFTIWQSYTYKNIVGIFTPLLLMAVPLFEIFFIVVIRIVLKKPLFKGSPDHFALRLNKFMSVRKTVLLVYWIAFYLCLNSFIIVNIPLKFALLLYLTVLISFIIFAKWLISIKL